MEQLFTPNVGLMVWTVVTFLLLVGVLGRFGWKPLIRAIDEREERLKNEREAAERARAEAQRIQEELRVELSQIEARARELLSKAEREGAGARDQIVRSAQEEAKRVVEKTRGQLEEEKRRLVAELRQEVAELAVTAAERLLKKSVTPAVQKGVLDDFFRELEKGRKLS